MITTLTIHIDNSIIAINAFLMSSSVFSALGILIGLGTVKSSLLIYLSFFFLLTYGVLVWLARQIYY